MQIVLCQTRCQKSNGKADKALELVKHMERRNRLPDLEAEAAKIGLEGDGVAELLRPYLELISRRYGRLPLGALDPSGQESANISLGQVFINLNGNYVLQEDQESFKWMKSALGQIYAARHSILLGDPGSGKSTLLRYLAYCLAQSMLQPEENWLAQLSWSIKQMQISQFSKSERAAIASKSREEPNDDTWAEIQVQWQPKVPIPIFVELRDFARTSFDPLSPLAIWQFVCQQLEKENLAEMIEPLARQAKRGQVIFLLDGVDEVPVKQRPSIWQAINSHTDGLYGNNRWVTTCRILSFVAAETPIGVPVQTLRSLDEVQINQFIVGWYTALNAAGALSQTEAETKTRSLQQAAQRPRLQPLAQNPMLLTIMALVQTFYGTLPDERARLYQACVETLLLRWQRHKESGSGGDLPDVLSQLDTTQADLERLFWAVAWKAHSEAGQREDAADIPEWDVLQIAREMLGSLSKAEQFLEYTERRAHLLVGRGGEKERVYTFPHRTFQEYLAACHLAAERRFGRKAAKLAESDTWRETLNLAVGTLVFNQNNREKALDGIKDVLPRQVPEPADTAGWMRVWLAGEMMTVVGRETAEKDEVGQEILPRLREMLVALLAAGALTPPQRAEAGDALGLLGDPRPGVCTREPELIFIPAGPFLMHDDKQTVQVEAFAIARYPVTNAQYRFFVDAGAYENPEFWTKEGWQQRQQEKWAQPRYWDNSFISIDNKPVVGVSWYEAVAYCNWLSAATGKTYRLPTEAEWERAARHTDGRTYPWGDEWQDGIINSSEAKVGRTTAVASFPHSAAECGAHDMSGNVWEWCQTRWRDEQKKKYPLPYRGDDGRENLRGGTNIYRCCRGGAFHDNITWSCRAADRYNYHPLNRDDHISFRVGVAEHFSARS